MRQTTFIATSDKSPIPFSPYFCIVNKPIEYMETKKTTREEYQKCVNAVVDYINLHLGEEIDLKSLAKISHFSPFYFHRIMKAFLGEPIGTFIVRTRTETAARLLRYTDLPIADIAYRIGYSSSSSLSKVFKQFYGISPLEYRNNKNFVIMKPAIIRPELKLKREIKELPASPERKCIQQGHTSGRTETPGKVSAAHHPCIRLCCKLYQADQRTAG